MVVFGTLLWLLNWLPIQTPQYLCSSSAIVSETRWETFARLSRQPEIPSELIAWMVYQQPTGTAAMDRKLRDDMRVIRVQVGLKHEVTPREIDRELERLTRVGSVSGMREPLERHASQHRWKLRVAEHALFRFRLDREREGVAIAETGSSSPFRLASQSSVVGLASADLAAWKALQDALATSQQSLHAAEAELKKFDTQSQGFIGLTGRPRLTAHSGGISWQRLVLMMAIGIAMSAVLAVWMFGRTPRRTIELSQSLRSLGVPYWGAIRIDGDWQSLPQDPSIAPRTARAAGGCWGPKRVGQLAAFADGLIAVWVAVFFCRYLIDTEWRDLLFRAPLAAFSSVVFGI